MSRSAGKRCFQQRVLGRSGSPGQPCAKEVNSYLALYAKFNSKLMNDTDIRANIMKGSEKNMGKSSNLRFGKEFLDMTPKPTEEKINSI